MGITISMSGVMVGLCVCALVCGSVGAVVALCGRLLFGAVLGVGSNGARLLSLCAWWLVWGWLWSLGVRRWCWTLGLSVGVGKSGPRLPCGWGGGGGGGFGWSVRCVGLCVDGLVAAILE